MTSWTTREGKTPPCSPLLFTESMPAMKTPPTPQLLNIVDCNLRAVRETIAAAHDRAGRTDPLPLLVAVTKYAQPDWIQALYALGERDFGENRPQQLQARQQVFLEEYGFNDIRWHLIGQLQRNKARHMLELATCIHSADSLKLLSHLDRLADEMALRPKILLQVNVSGETTKSGFTPEQVTLAIPELADFQHLDITGLMTMAPYTSDQPAIRAVFRGLRELRDRMREQLPELMPLRELSMGMTNDFEIAVEEGATLVRVGSGLFENCDQG